MSFLEKNLPSPNDLLHLMFTSPTIVDFFDCADISSAVGSVGPSACAGTWVLTLSRRASSPHQLRNACRQWARSPVFEPFRRLRAAAPCAESSVVSKRLHCTGDRMCHKTRVLQGWSDTLETRCCRKGHESTVFSASATFPLKMGQHGPTLSEKSTPVGPTWPQDGPT